MRGNALGSYRKRSAPPVDGAASVSSPSLPRYQVVAVVSGSGNDGAVVENAGIGDFSAPTSNSTRTRGSDW